MRQLAVGPRTRAELAAALRQRRIAADVIAAVLERYTEVGIIDDQAFAKAWVTSRHHGRGLARRALASELRRKGVESAAVGEALAELDDETEAETALSLVERRLRTERGRGSTVAIFRRLVGMLARKGYAPALAVRIVKQAMAERDDAASLDEVLDIDILEAEAAEADASEREAERQAEVEAQRQADRELEHEAEPEVERGDEGRRSSPTVAVP